MNGNEYNPNDDEFLNNIKKFKQKQTEIVKYNEAIDKASEDIPISKIKEQAKEFNNAKQKKIIIIISTVLLVIAALILCILFCFNGNYTTKKEQGTIKPDTTSEEHTIIMDKPDKTLDINVVYFSKTDFNADINKRLTSYLDSLKIADSIDIFKLHIINSGEVIESDNVYEVAMELGSNQYEARNYSNAAKLINDIAMSNTKNLFAIGILPKYDGLATNNIHIVEKEQLIDIKTVFIYDTRFTNEYHNTLIDVFEISKKWTR